jgi:hypothetical protein
VRIKVRHQLIEVGFGEWIFHIDGCEVDKVVSGVAEGGTGGAQGLEIGEHVGGGAWGCVCV